MPDSEAHMFGYWSDKYGHVVALRDYFPDLLASRPDLQQAVAMIENGHRAIEAIMEPLAEESSDRMMKEQGID